MKVFDDKSKDVFQNDKYLVVTEIDEETDVTFKASYMVISDLVSKNKITALFDLIVLGDIEAAEIDVKGKLICLGSCKIDGSVVVQNDIWTNEIVAESIVSHGQITAQDIDTNTLNVDGSVVVGRTLSIEDIAEIGNNLLCGETAFGSGHIVAERVLTVEPLDLDDGIDAIEDPNEYHAQDKPEKNSKSFLTVGLEQYEKRNDYEGYIAFLLDHVSNEEGLKLNNWLNDLYVLDDLVKKGFDNFSDGFLMIRLLEILESDYFREWKIIHSWLKMMLNHFERMLHGTEKKYRRIPCSKLVVGETVVHKKYGKGKVVGIEKNNNGAYCEIVFSSLDGDFSKKFIAPECYKFFEIFEEIELDNSTKIEKIYCEIKSYSDWLKALTVIDHHKKDIGEIVYSALFDRIMAYVGLKAKFMNDRFKDKGWN